MPNIKITAEDFEKKLNDICRIGYMSESVKRGMSDQITEGILDGLKKRNPDIVRKWRTLEERFEAMQNPSKLDLLKKLNSIGY